MKQATCRTKFQKEMKNQNDAIIIGYAIIPGEGGVKLFCNSGVV